MRNISNISSEWSYVVKLQADVNRLIENRMDDFQRQLVFRLPKGSVIQVQHGPPTIFISGEGSKMPKEAYIVQVVDRVLNKMRGL